MTVTSNASITMKSLLETGVHFGHRVRKWNPKMRPYIFTERNGIHIIDLHQTLKALREAYDVVREQIADGGSILFVGTKRQAQEIIAREAQRCGMPYVNQRWLGGTLTNWRTIRQRIEYLKDLEARRDRGEFDLLAKKEALNLNRKIEKLNARLGGIREMKDLPNLLFVVDVRREHTAVHEANILNIPIIAMVDTNCDPDPIDYVIPANDDAIRAIKLITGVIADAVLEGLALRKEEEEEAELAEVYDYEAAAEEEVADEDFLGQATLEKLKSGVLDFGDEEEEAEAAEEEEAAPAEAQESPADEAPADEAVAGEPEAGAGETAESEAEESNEETPES
ncbi:MAG TPA: 30S ribosomal protein S2 [Chloroflexi bacterium]|nr:30S ribosomal protein S2 [Chloroflexota bacterium]